MLTCYEATQLMSSRLDRPMSAKESLNLRFHLMMCKSCHRCDLQFDLIHQAGQRWHKKMIEEGKIDPDADV